MVHHREILIDRIRAELSTPLVTGLCPRRAHLVRGRSPALLCELDELVDVGAPDEDISGLVDDLYA